MTANPQCLQPMILEPADAEDYAAAPPLTCGTLVQGRLYLLPRPHVRHARAETELGRRLGDGGPPGGWWILAEVEIHLEADNPEGPFIVVPDLSGWRKATLPALPDAPFMTVPPDWLCEILSPSTRHLDYGVKLPRYAHHRVPWLWMLDPYLKTLDVLRWDNGSYAHHRQFQNAAAVQTEPFPDLSFNLADLWIE